MEDRTHYPLEDKTNFTVKCPPGKLMKILAFNFDLQTGNVAGNRFVGYEIINPGLFTFAEALTPPLSELEKLYGICGFSGATAAATQVPRTVLLPLPDIWLPEGWAINYISLGKQAGDSFPLVRTLYTFGS